MNFKLAVALIFFTLAASRFIPHPPNFTSLISLSFYVPVLFGTRYIPVVLLSFILTDIFLGFHDTIFFTWGSIFLISFISNFFKAELTRRLIGNLFGSTLFFLITNFGVWLTGLYEFNFNGLITCYILALPFFGNTIVSTLFFASIIETIYFFFKKKFLEINK